ncbi:hypothetical protein Tco_1511430, partial [Tanacetum coccineum]
EYGVSTSIGYGISSSLSNTAYSSQQINTAYPLSLDTAYRSSEIEILKELQEVIAEPILSNNMEKAPTKLNLSITSNDINIEPNKEFLVELRKNIYHGTYNEHVVDHVAKISEGDEQITTWEELFEKFFCRFYPESYDGADEMLDEGEKWGINLLEFLLNVNTLFKNHKKVDRRTQKVIFHSWMNRNWNKRYVDNSILSNNELKGSKYENPPNTATDSFFKAYEARDIEKQ